MRLPPVQGRRIAGNSVAFTSLSIENVTDALCAIATVVGLVPVQSQAGFFGVFPRCPGDPARFIGANFFTRDHEGSHFAHACGVVAGRVGVLAEEAEAFLADRWQIARHPVTSYRL